MIEGIDVLKQRLIKRIGDGQTTNIWSDHWLPRDEILRPYGCIAANPPELVSQPLDATSATWNRERIQELFMPMDIPVILSIPICTQNMKNFGAVS